MCSLFYNEQTIYIEARRSSLFFCVSYTRRLLLCQLTVSVPPRGRNATVALHHVQNHLRRSVFSPHFEANVQLFAGCSPIAADVVCYTLIKNLVVINELLGRRVQNIVELIQCQRPFISRKISLTSCVPKDSSVKCLSCFVLENRESSSRFVTPDSAFRG